ncbi:hypothetical protein [Parasitella parasitica]|uniref:Uncharacterized protein n=1 Tax=Parasitella parasitica TaxID=35722 RepID=A0A0B7MRV4_9FUNG|nr:hypothetical protein [Parasitella parasitica]
MKGSEPSRYSKRWLRSKDRLKMFKGEFFWFDYLSEKGKAVILDKLHRQQEDRSRATHATLLVFLEATKEKDIWNKRQTTTIILQSFEYLPEATNVHDKHTQFVANFLDDNLLVGARNLLKNVYGTDKTTEEHWFTMSIDKYIDVAYNRGGFDALEGIAEFMIVGS